MPHLSLTLRPGVDVTDTPAFNQAGISASNLIRFMPSVTGAAVVQPIGGWTKFYPAAMATTVRALWPWSTATTGNNFLAVGAVNSLSVIYNWTSLSSTGAQTAITPQTSTTDVTPNFSTIATRPTVTVVDTGVQVTSYDSVYIETPVTIGGLVLFGQYQITGSGTNTYTITSVDVLGNPLPATATVNNAGAVASYAVTVGSNQVVVTFANHGYSVGGSYPVIVPTTLGGVTIGVGNYAVLQVQSSSQFTIQAAQTANSSTSASQNGGYAHSLYYFASSALAGYGSGGYGTGGYGTSTGSTGLPGAPITVTDWYLDNWGNILIASPVGGAIYAWDASQNSQVASVIPQAPQVNAGVLVAMPQRQIIAWGSTFNGVQDALLVRWCDVENYTVWAAQTNNQAGSYRLTRGSRIVGALQAPQQGLLWTDVGLWAVQYVGQPYVYSFNEIGNGCGLISRKAAASLDGTVYWMSQSQFFYLTANGVTPLACPVWDTVFQNLDTANVDKIRVATNSRFEEIAWFYPVIGGGGENTNYVKYNAILQVWDYGVLGRSAWVDQSILGPPIAADPVSGYLYQHETSTLADGATIAASFTTGFFAVNEADNKGFVDEVWPDMKWGYYNGTQNGSVQMTFNGTDFASQTPLTYGPFNFTNTSTYVSPRLRARLLSITIASSPANQGFWRLGNIRYRAQPDGKY